VSKKQPGAHFQGGGSGGDGSAAHTLSGDRKAVEGKVSRSTSLYTTEECMLRGAHRGVKKSYNAAGRRGSAAAY